MKDRIDAIIATGFVAFLIGLMCGLWALSGNVALNSGDAKTLYERLLKEETARHQKAMEGENEHDNRP